MYKRQPTDGVFLADYRYTVPLVLNGSELTLGTIGVGSWDEGAGGTAQGMTPTHYRIEGLENRTIVSGIAQHYKPEELVGKQVLFIANLAPRQFKNGLVSEGMILSAENYDGSLAVTSLLKEVKPGSEVK